MLASPLVEPVISAYSSTVVRPVLRLLSQLAPVAHLFAANSG